MFERDVSVAIILAVRLVVTDQPVQIAILSGDESIKTGGDKYGYLWFHYGLPLNVVVGPGSCRVEQFDAGSILSFHKPRSKQLVGATPLKEDILNEPCISLREGRFSPAFLLIF